MKIIESSTPLYKVYFTPYSYAFGTSILALAYLYVPKQIK